MQEIRAVENSAIFLSRLREIGIRLETISVLKRTAFFVDIWISVLPCLLFALDEGKQYHTIVSSGQVIVKDHSITHCLCNQSTGRLSAGNRILWLCRDHDVNQ